jgi:hypothetical protein
MDFTSEFWAGVMAGVFGTFGMIVVVSLAVVLLLVRLAPVMPDSYDAGPTPEGYDDRPR